MRDLKFRVWDKKDKKWLTDEFIIFADGTFGLIDPYCWDGGVTTHQDYVGDSRLAVMQYAGLKDKKRTAEYPEGQEIYEGDVVQHGTYKAAEVRYSDYLTSFCLIFNDGHDGHYARALGQCSRRLEFIGEEIEVLGNIYEHPTLIQH